MAGAFGSLFGRKTCLALACIVSFAACGIQIGTTSKAVLYFGRVLLGFSNGFFVTFSNVYVAEAAPTHLRGVLVALYAYFMTIGSILGTVVDNYSKDRLDKSSYQIPIASLCIIPAILTIGLVFVPESPRWLLYKGRDERARKSLEKLRADSVASEYLELEWAEMVRGVEEEKSVAKGISILDMFRGEPIYLQHLFSQPLCLIPCLGVMFGQFPNS